MPADSKFSKMHDVSWYILFVSEEIGIGVKLIIDKCKTNKLKSQIKYKAIYYNENVIKNKLTEISKIFLCNFLKTKDNKLEKLFISS